MGSHQGGVKIKVENRDIPEPSSQNHLQDSEQSVTTSENSAIVLRHKDEEASERLISDEMGTEIVKILIGEKLTVFNIHKNLIRKTSAFFDDVFKNDLPIGKELMLKGDDPDVFKLFVEFLYTKRIPAVAATMAAPAQALRTKRLCQLYAFADRLHLQFEIRNRTMDCIQDAFFIMGKFPEPGLVQAIYTNSPAGSMLRRFAMAGVYHWFRSAENTNDEEFKALLRHNIEVLDDFLEYVRSGSFGKDPRIRQCHGWEGCVECASLGHDRIANLGGVFPCEFHIHQGVVWRIKEGADGPAGSNVENVEHIDGGCYSWTEFPDMGWMQKYALKMG